MHTILALDFGEKRIGCALADRQTCLPLPYATIQVRNQAQALEEILNIIKKEQVEEIVVGLPLNREGQDTQKTQEVRAFVSTLQARTSVSVATIDERFTSRMSEEGVTTKDRVKGIIDQNAAQMILERYVARGGIRQSI